MVETWASTTPNTHHKANIKLLQWPSQSPDPIENMLTVLKSEVCASKITNVIDICQEE